MHGYLNGRLAWRNERGVDVSAKGSFVVRIYMHACITDPLSETWREFSCKTDSNMPLFFFSFFFPARLQTRSIFPPSSGRNAPRRGTCDEFSRNGGWSRYSGTLVFEGMTGGKGSKFGKRSWRLMYSILVGMTWKRKKFEDHFLSFLFFLWNRIE